LVHVPITSGNAIKIQLLSLLGTITKCYWNCFKGTISFLSVYLLSSLSLAPRLVANRPRKTTSELVCMALTAQTHWSGQGAPGVFYTSGATLWALIYRRQWSYISIIWCSWQQIFTLLQLFKLIFWLHY